MDFKKWVRLDYGMTYLANETIIVAVTAEASGNGAGTCQVEISTSLEKPESVFPAYKLSAHGQTTPATSVSLTVFAGTYLKVSGTPKSDEFQVKVAAMIPAQYISQSIERKKDAQLQQGKV